MLSTVAYTKRALGDNAPEHAAGARLANEANAKALYHEETVLQGGPEYPPDDPGGSGIGVCKAAVEMGLIASYTHGFGLEHAQGAIGVSPFIIGVMVGSS